MLGHLTKSRLIVNVYRPYEYAILERNKCFMHVVCFHSFFSLFCYVRMSVMLVEKEIAVKHGNYNV